MRDSGNGPLDVLVIGATVRHADHSLRTALAGLDAGLRWRWPPEAREHVGYGFMVLRPLGGGRPRLP
ncbi:hypothetical protein M877_28285 [Streptomyces niveus NCIMB 11891]|nr:hypothetical protein M877_28285 [Streptomyces niveus NCIMB 11891]